MILYSSCHCDLDPILPEWYYWSCYYDPTEHVWVILLRACLYDPIDPDFVILLVLSKWSYWSELVILLFLVDWSYWSSIYISFMTTQDLYRDHYLSACSGFLCSVKCVGNCLLLQQQDNQWIDLRTLSHLYVQFLDILHNRHDRFKTTMKTVDWAVIFI